MTYSTKIKRKTAATVVTAKKFLRGNEGTVAIEAAGIIPLFLLMMVVFAETSKGNHLSTQVGQTAATVSDIISQAETMNATDIDGALQAGRAIAGQAANDIKISVVGVEITENGSGTNSKVKWSRAINGGALPPKNSTYPLPASLMTQPGFVIVSETKLDYSPAIGYTITGTIPLGSKYYFFPRVGSATSCDDCN